MTVGVGTVVGCMFPEPASCVVPGGLFVDQTRTAASAARSCNLAEQALEEAIEQETAAYIAYNQAVNFYDEAWARLDELERILEIIEDAYRDYRLEHNC